MEKIIDFEKCSGCYACFNICPKGCIEMTADEEGFLYPHIDGKRCIDCGMCKKVCPGLKKYNGNPCGRAYACISSDTDTRMKSSSGGVFGLIAEYIIGQGGVVFGAAFDQDLSVHHVEITDACDLDKLRGSKYLQSRIESTYQRAQEYLDAGRLVLFGGTPCQISGLKAYLGKDYENLIMQDLICHGVPSPSVWQRYLSFVERKSDDRIDKEVPPFFRDKKRGWKRFSLSFSLVTKGRVSMPLDKDLFMKAFLNNLCLRPTCYSCLSKSVERESDITLADFWGADKVCPEFFDDKGTSLVLINSGKGQRIFDAIMPKMRFAEVDFEAALAYNPAVRRSASRPEKRETFMKMVGTLPFDEAVRACITISPVKVALNLAKRILRKVIK